MFKFVCNCAIVTPSIPNLELSRTSSFLSSWTPSWTLTVFAHFHKDVDMLSELTSCIMISLYPFPSRFLHVEQRHHSIFHPFKARILCHLGLLSVQGLSTV